MFELDYSEVPGNIFDAVVDAENEETSTDGGIKTEKSAILDSPTTGNSDYGSTPPLQEKPDPTEGLYIPKCGLIFYVMSFFGFFCAFSLRQVTTRNSMV